MKRVITSLVLFLSTLVSAQSFEDFINDLNAISSTQTRQAKVDSFFTANQQYPMREFDTLAHYLLKGNYNSVDLAGDINSWQTGVDALQNMAGTDMWYLTHVYPSHARLDYKYVANGSWILDPRNPDQVSGGFGPNSELSMPAYVQPWEIQNYSGVPKGQITSYNMPSAIMGNNYQVQIYLPPNYDSSSTYPTAYFHDGQEYIGLASAGNILDNLIDSNLIQPLIGVFVRPNNRNDEYAFAQRDAYTDFFATELVPWVDSQYSTIQDSSMRATIGASFGGNISAYITTQYPDVFGLHGQHSGAWWPNNFEVANLIATDPNQYAMPMASVWGNYEGGLTDMWIIFEDSMTFYQYPNKYFQGYPEGHSWGLWRATLDELLIHLFPNQGIGVPEELVSENEETIALFPNPTSEAIRLLKNDEEEVTIQIRNLNGQLIREGTLSTTSSFYVADLTPGVYLVQIQSEEGSQTQRVIIE